MKKYILNRAMFRQVKSPAYGTGIASNLVSSEERQRYNYGGRVGFENAGDVGFQQSPFMKQMRAIGEPLYNYGVRPLYNIARHPAKWMGEAFGYGETADFPYQEAIDITEEGEQFYPFTTTKKSQPKKKIEGWQDRNRPGGQHPLYGDPHDTVEKESDVLDIRVGDEGPWTMKGEEKTAIEKELDPGADLKGEPKEDPIVKLLRENEERAKKRGKVAALAQGVSMASHLLDKPFSKAVAAAGKEAPMLAKAYSDEVKSAEGLPLQWDMIKEKIQLEGEQAIKKAEVGEERKAAYQSGYLNYLKESLAEASRNPDSTVTSLFDTKTNQSLSLTANDQVNALAQIASKKGKVIDVQAIDISKKENYKDIRKGTIVRDTKSTGQWYIMDEDGVLGKPTSVLDVTIQIDEMPMVTKP